MNDLDTELETAIRGALATDAARSPRLAPQWDDLPRYADAPVERRRSPWGKVAVIGLAAAAIGGAVAIRSTSASKVRIAAFVPAGVEFPLTDLGPATQSMSITTDGLSRKVSVPGLDSLTVERSLDLGIGPTAVLGRCFFPGTLGIEGSFGMCNTEGMGSRIPEVLHSVGQSSTNGVPDPPFDYAIWTNVPRDAAFVAFTSGSQELWQRPVSGMAVFPTMGLATAYSADGTELARIDFFNSVSSGPAADDWPIYDISDAQNEELRLLTVSATAACLTAHGGTIAGGSNVAVFDPSINQIEIWDSCVAETKRIVAERLAAMNVPLVKSP